MGNIVLPTQKTAINKNFKDSKFGMLGLGGIGKSCFWAQEPNALFLETEAGLNALEVYKVPIRSWQDMRDTYVTLIEAQKKGEFKYSIIIIDTIDRLVDFAQEEVICKAKEFYKKIEINTVGDIPNGSGWFKTKEIVMALLGKLELLNCAIAYVAHLSVKRIKETTGEYDKATISIGGQLGEDLLAWTDHTLNIESHMIGDKLTRIVFAKPSQSREAKSRGGIIPDGWRWTEDMKENYNYFRKLFI